MYISLEKMDIKLLIRMDITAKLIPNFIRSLDAYGAYEVLIQPR